MSENSTQFIRKLLYEDKRKLYSNLHKDAPSVLKEVKNFLPIIKKANEELENNVRENSEAFDMENVSDDKDGVIDMEVILFNDERGDDEGERHIGDIFTNNQSDLSDESDVEVDDTSQSERPLKLSVSTHHPVGIELIDDSSNSSYSSS